MRYTIFSIDDSRAEYSVPLRNYLKSIGWIQDFTKCVNGNHPEELWEEDIWHGYRINAPMRVGQLGILYTVLNSFHLAPHLTFEDDAVLGHNFGLNWHFRSREIPPNFDFFALFNARNNDHLYDSSYDVSKYLCKVYQKYGGVSMYYSMQGVYKIKRLLERDGIWGQFDDMLYAYAKAGELNGYQSKPEYANLVGIANVPSIVQNTKEYN